MMMYDSFESEELKALIENRKKFLAKQTSKTAAQYIQKEIMFLQEKILPVVLGNTTILYGEIGKYAIRCYDMSVKRKCNALLLYLPIKDDYTERPLIGIANCRDMLDFGTPGGMQIRCNHVDIINADGCTRADDVETGVLPIHEML
jgi:hypothetical protein